MELMKCSLAEQDDEFAVRQLHGSRQRIEIDIAATRRIEALVDPTEPIPGIAAEKKRVRFLDLREPSVDRTLIESRDVKEAVAILRPTDRGQHLVFALLIVTGFHRPSLQVAPQIPAQRDHRGAPIKLHAATREMKHARRDDAGAVDHDADDFAARLGKPAVDRARRRGRRRIETEQVKVASQTVDPLCVEWGHRAVLHDDDLVWFTPKWP